MCGTCGASSLRWEGQCRSCGGWNTLVETPVERGHGASATARKRATAAAPPVTPLASLSATDTDRLPLGIREVDRVLGGGIVPGSLLLLGGEPGIGKSTLVLAMAAAIARTLPDARVLYASGEESATQIRLRAARLGVAGGIAGEGIDVLPETSVERIVAAAEASAPALVIVDSIQTMTTDDLEGTAGSVGQVRSSAALLQAYAKENGVPVMLVGHVTKDGTLAGPKDSRAHRRRGADPRGRALLRPPTPALGQEPLRVDRGGRRLRDDGRWPGRGSRPRRSLPRARFPRVARASRLRPRSRAAARCWSRSRRS